MKKDTHPKYVETTITCACGNVIHTRATVENMRVELCSQCHPYYTGKQKLVDSAGRVERYRRRYGLDEKGNKKESKKDEGKKAEETGGKEEGK